MSILEIQTVKTLLGANTYPGRGIILGRSDCGRKAVIVYFIMGRSENSRNRIFVETADGIKTEAHDPSKMTDPSLIIYHPVRRARGCTIVTNGDQTDTVFEALLRGHSYRRALLFRTFEPDAPNYTPRISGLMLPNGDYRLSILKSAGGDPDSVNRFFYEYDASKPGIGHLIHTYRCDGDPIPSYEGEPAPVAVSGDAGAYARLVWDALDAKNRVSLFTRSIDLADGTTENVVINKNIGEVYHDRA